MTVTLHLKPEVEASLQAQAQANGMRFDDYLLNIVEEAASPASGRPSSSSAEAVRRMLEFGDNHKLDLGEPITRALLHEEHRF